MTMAVKKHRETEDLAEQLPSMTQTQLIDLRARVVTTIQHMKADIDEAKLKFARGQRANERWWRAVNSALFHWRKLEVELAAELSRRRLARQASNDEAHARFVAAAAQALLPATFDLLAATAGFPPELFARYSIPALTETV